MGALASRKDCATVHGATPQPHTHFLTIQVLQRRVRFVNREDNVPGWPTAVTKIAYIEAKRAGKDG